MTTLEVTTDLDQQVCENNGRQGSIEDESTEFCACDSNCPITLMRVSTNERMDENPSVHIIVSICVISLS